MKAVYPLKFEPILKEKIWGGTKLNELLHKKSSAANVGESWEISDVEDSNSLVANGVFKGKNLQELIQQHPLELLGQKNYERFGSKFPLLIKFIDATKVLSVQLHPDDDLAKARHNSFGKTEMWYVLQADDNANLIVGFNQPMTSETYLKHLNEHSLTDILNSEEVKAGDTYFIEAGRIHAIGAGVLLAEIQQTSDLTYRVYDWDRLDDQGNGRELHNDVAIDAFKFDLEDNYKVDYETTTNQVNDMVDCPYFTTRYLDLNTKLDLKNNHDSFIIYMCVEGSAKITVNNHSEELSLGETLLLPAAVDGYSIEADSTKLLQIYI